MFTWLHWILDPPAEPSTPEELRAERRRLEEAIACYREFGFDAQVVDARDRIRHLDRLIRESKLGAGRERD